jgi:hypothetical protein
MAACRSKALPLYSGVLAVLGHRLGGSDDESGDLGFGPRASKSSLEILPRLAGVSKESENKGSLRNINKFQN